MANNSRIGLFLFQTYSTFMATQSSIFYMFQKQSTTNSSLTVFGLFFSILLNLLQLKYQGINNTDPFSTHPKTMRVSVISLLLYCLIYGIKLKFSRHYIYRKFSYLVHHLMIFFSSLSLASTASLLFPDSVSPVLYFLCFLLSGAEMLHWVFEKIMQKFKEEEEESYYYYERSRMSGEPIWNYLRRRANRIVYPMEQRFALTV
ncbi:hypothetical protein EJD97_010827 [Solanum chilense]|uniref:Uncharacterized protein n=1 Tax=Solanum chilense TaxID=4083 RepID=A0A6N2AGA3_SOLCI|nr:hypothetical protein EJD97_010827 [Solanum chilense]